MDKPSYIQSERKYSRSVVTSMCLNLEGMFEFLNETEWSVEAYNISVQHFPMPITASDVAHYLVFHMHAHPPLTNTVKNSDTLSYSLG